MTEKNPASSPPPVEDAELDRLMDAFHIAAQKLNVAPHLIHNQVTGNALEGAYTRARGALRSYVSARDAHIGILEEELASSLSLDEQQEMHKRIAHKLAAMNVVFNGRQTVTKLDSAMRERPQ